MFLNAIKMCERGVRGETWSREMRVVKSVSEYVDL